MTKEMMFEQKQATKKNRNIKKKLAKFCRANVELSYESLEDYCLNSKFKISQQ